MQQLPNQSRTELPPSEAYLRNREHILSLNPESAAIAPSAAAADVWGVLMEFRSQDVFVSFVSTADGTTSLYFSNGASVLGGGAHSHVTQAAGELLKMAQSFRFPMEPTTRMPQPSPRNVRFFLLTFAGVLTAEAPETDLLEGSDQLAPLFYKVQEVITQLRLTVEMQGR